MADDPRSFSPNKAQPSRSRTPDGEQPELDLRGDPVPDAPAAGSDRLADADVISPDIDEPDNPELDWGEPLEGAGHSGNHANRLYKTEADTGHGRRTIQRNKEINSGRLYR